MGARGEVRISVQEVVAAVINTGYSSSAMRDGFHIRRAAVERGISCFTGW